MNSQTENVNPEGIDFSIPKTDKTATFQSDILHLFTTNKTHSNSQSNPHLDRTYHTIWNYEIFFIYYRR